MFEICILFVLWELDINFDFSTYIKRPAFTND